MKRVSLGLAAGGCLLILSCVGESGGPRPMSYTLSGDLGGPPPAAAPATARGDLTLRVARVSAAPWLMQDGIYYRLDYHDPGRIAPYADARWVAPAPRMLKSLVAEALDRGQSWKAVLDSDDVGTADFALSLQLLELVQEFASPTRSFGVLRARATLVDARTASVVAQRSFDYRVAAPTPDAAGGVRAERQASRRFALDVATWIGRMDLPMPTSGDQGASHRQGP